MPEIEKVRILSVANVLNNLSKVPIDSSHRAGEDDAAVVLLPHVGPGRLHS